MNIQVYSNGQSIGSLNSNFVPRVEDSIELVGKFWKVLNVVWRSADVFLNVVETYDQRYIWGRLRYE